MSRKNKAAPVIFPYWKVYIASSLFIFLCGILILGEFLTFGYFSDG